MLPPPRSPVPGGADRSSHRTLIFFFLLRFLLGLFSPTGVLAGSGTVTILYTNDTHSRLEPFDLPEFGQNIGGVARREVVIRQIRRTASPTLLLDAGDLFQGTPFFTFFHGEPEILSANLLGYDATTFGNHEIDGGLANLQAQLAKARFPLLCANVLDAASGTPVFPTHQIFHQGDLTIGVTGCIGSEAWDVISPALRKGLTFLDPIPALAALAARLRPQVDLLILLSHSGYEVDLALAQKLNLFDLIIGGHTNTYLEKPILVKRAPLLVPNKAPNAVGGTLVVQAFKWGVFLGRLDLTLAGGKGLADFSGRLIPITASVAVPLDSPVARLVEGYKQRIESMTNQRIGDNPLELPYPEEEKHRRALPLGRFVCEAMRRLAEADCAIINSGCIRTHLPAGPLTMGHLMSLLPFENTLVRMTIRGEHLREMLEFICLRFGSITGYQYGGIGCVFDLARRQVRDITVGGAPLDPGKDYRLVTISYLADGAQNGKELFRAARNSEDLGFFARDAVIEVVRREGQVKVPAGPSVIVEGDGPGVNPADSTTGSPTARPPN